MHQMLTDFFAVLSLVHTCAKLAIKYIISNRTLNADSTAT